MAALGLVACSTDETRQQLPPPTTSVDEAVASPTDPAATAPPTSTAEKVIPESGTPPTESVYLEVDATVDAPVYASTVVGSPARILITSDVAREFYLVHEDRALTGVAVEFRFVAEDARFYEIVDRVTGELIVSLEAITE